MPPQMKPHHDEFEISVPTLSNPHRDQPKFFPPFSPLKETQLKQNKWLEQQHRRRSGDSKSSSPSIPIDIRDISVLPRRKSQQKTVTFVPVIRYKTVVHISEYSDEELDAAFYNDDELENIREESIETIEMIVSKVQLPEDHLCARGLEYKTPAGTDFRRKNKFRALQAVLQEQKVQVELGILNPEAIAESYMQSSDKCKRIAQLLAARDEEEVQAMKQAGSKSRRFRSSRPGKSSRRSSAFGSAPLPLDAATVKPCNEGFKRVDLPQITDTASREKKAARRASTSTTTFARRIEGNKRVESKRRKAPTSDDDAANTNTLSSWKTFEFVEGEQELQQPKRNGSIIMSRKRSTFPAS
jgi:hypothetical protein